MPQPTPERIDNSRLTLISGQAFFDHLRDPSAPLADRLWTPADHSAIFNALRGGASHPRYDFPWRPSQSSAFWRAYGEGVWPGQLSAEAAQRLVMPFRMKASQPPAVTLQDGPERIFFDAYAYPHGVVTALTVQLAPRTPMPLDAWRDRMRALRNDSIYTVALPGGGSTPSLVAGQALAMINDWFRDTYFGPVATISSSDEPLSVVVVIRGEGVDATADLASRPDLQTLLNAVTAWPVNWRDTRPPPLDEAALPVRGVNATAGDALYAARRGRTLWRPGLFTYRAPAGARLHTLSCLSHNQIAGIVQAESLRLFAVRYAALSQPERSAVPARLRLRVATQTSRLWRGENTYRSSSVARLLQDPTSLAQVNSLLVEMGLDAIG